MRCSPMRDILFLGFVLACVGGAIWCGTRTRAECEARGGRLLDGECLDRSIFR